jgi:glycosyltransferase involved in cell wall biosynthesis
LLFVTPSLCIGGAERQLVQLLQNLDPRRYAITVAVFTGADEAGQDGFYEQVSAMPNVRLTVLSRGGRFDLLGPVRSLVRLIRAERIQLMHTFLNLASTFGVVASKITGVPIVASAIRSSRDPNLVYRACRTFQAFASDVLVSNSEAGFDNRFRRRRRNFRVIGNGLYMPRFTAQPELVARLGAELNLSRFSHLVGMVATLSAVKDHRAFLQIAARVVTERPKTGFLVIGDGPNRAALEAMSAQLGLENNVVFAGYRADVDTLTGLLDVACLFTNYRVISEGLPNAVMEAMACAVPVVATDDGGTVEILHDGVEGFLVARNDLDVSTRLILRLLDDEMLRHAMGERGHASAKAKFSLDVCVGKYEEIYRQLLREMPLPVTRSVP